MASQQRSIRGQNLQQLGKPIPASGWGAECNRGSTIRAKMGDTPVTYKFSRESQVVGLRWDPWTRQCVGRQAGKEEQVSMLGFLTWVDSGAVHWMRNPGSKNREMTGSCQASHRGSASKGMDA